MLIYLAKDYFVLNNFELCIEVLVGNVRQTY